MAENQQWIRAISRTALIVSVSLSPVIMGAGSCLPTEADVAPMTAEAFCAQLPTIGYGHFFYCGSSQSNLQQVAFPDGSLGYCMSANENLGLVGYSATTYNGGAAPVMSQSRASELSRSFGSQSSGYVRCTRQ